MNMMKHPDERRRSHVDGRVTSGSYEIVMRLSVEDSALLWRAAAARAFTCMDHSDDDLAATFKAFEKFLAMMEPHD